MSPCGTHSTALTATFKFKTSRTLLQNMFPAHDANFRFKSPGTVAYASFSMTTLKNMEWLGGSGYNHIRLCVHGVEHAKQDGSTLSGTYLPILFESLTDPIVSGREKIDMLKLLSSVDTFRHAESFRINTSWQGAHWGSFALEGLKEISLENQTANLSGENDDGILVYRYIPKVGIDNKGVSEAEYPVFIPLKEDHPLPKARRVFTAAKTKFKIDPLDYEALPTFYHIISRLAELPVFEIVSGKLVKTEGVSDVAQAYRIV